MIFDMLVLLGYFALLACGCFAGVLAAWIVLDRFSGYRP